MKETTKENKSFIIALVVAIIILIAIVAIGTYSFYTANVNGNGNLNGNSTINTVNLEASLNDGVLTGSNLIPGESVTKTFTVKNTGTGDITFKLVWKSVTNTFINQNDLKITLQENSTMKISESDNKKFPSTTTTETLIKDNLVIKAGETKNYTLTIKYKETSNDQNADMGRTFSGIIGITG